MAPKGKLFQIAEECKRYVPKEKNKKTKVSVSGKHYDEGKAISLSYHLDMYPQNIYDAYRHSEPSAQLSFVDELQNEAFYVEPFESDSQHTVQVNYEEVHDDDLLNRVITKEEQADSSYAAMESVIPEAPKYYEKEGYEEEKPATGLDKVVDKTDGEAYLKKKTPIEAETSDNQPVKGQEEKQQYVVDDDEFASDIQAILQGKKVFDPDRKKAVNKGEASPVEALKPKGNQGSQQKAPEPDPLDGSALDPSKNEHKIFEKIAQSMRYANSYDLGAIAMEKKFDQMENDIEEAELKKVTHSRDEKMQDAVVVEEKPKEKGVTAVEQPPGEQQLLTAENGGKYTTRDQLKAGDVVLMTDRKGEKIKNTCHAGLYAGDQHIIMLNDDNYLKISELTDTFQSKSIVLLRHQLATENTIKVLVEKINGLELSGESGPWVEIAYPPVSIDPSICESLPVHDQNKCKTFHGKVDIGTEGNDKFLMPLPLIRLMASAGLEIIDNDIQNASKDAIVQAQHNGQLQYAGHLKNQ